MGSSVSDSLIIINMGYHGSTTLQRSFEKRTPTDGNLGLGSVYSVVAIVLSQGRVYGCWSRLSSHGRTLVSL